MRLKPPNNQSEFEPDRAKSKTNIAENVFALGHETDNNCKYRLATLPFFFVPTITLTLFYTVTKVRPCLEIDA